MERGEVERMGDSLGPGAIIELVGRRAKRTSSNWGLMNVKPCSERHAKAEMQLTEARNNRTVR